VLYNGTSFSGFSEVSLVPGEYPSLEDVGMPDKEVRSVSIPTPGCTLTLYEELDFLGGTFVVAADTFDLVEAGGTAYASAKLACIPDPALILFSNFYYNGQSVAFGVGDVGDIAAASGFPDNELTSLRFLRQNCEARLFDSLNLATEGEGDNRFVDSDEPDLAWNEFNDVTSSMSVTCIPLRPATYQWVTLRVSGAQGGEFPPALDPELFSLYQRTGFEAVRVLSGEGGGGCCARALAGLGLCRGLISRLSGLQSCGRVHVTRTCPAFGLSVCEPCLI
jgi:hypothetical protein